jgi:hypothetical protein
MTHLKTISDRTKPKRKETLELSRLSPKVASIQFNDATAGMWFISSLFFLLSIRETTLRPHETCGVVSSIIGSRPWTDKIMPKRKAFGSFHWTLSRGSVL